MSMGGGTSTTTTTQELSPEQRSLIAPVIPIAQQYLANPPKQYAGSGIVDFNDIQKQSQQMTMDAANRMLPMANAMPGQITGLNQGFTNLGRGYGSIAQQFGNMTGGYDKLRKQENFLTSGDVLKTSSNPYLQGAIEAASRPTIQQFQQSILPGLQEDALSGGAYGGTRQGIAGGIAGQAAAQSLADIASKMSNENYQSGLGAMLQGMNSANDTLAGKAGVIGAKQGALQGVGQTLQAKEGLLAQTPSIMQGSLLPMQMREAVGQQQQMMQQQKLSETVQKFVNEQMIPFSVAQDVAQMAFGMPGGSTKSTSTQPGNPMMGIQAGMGALGMLPMLLGKSDRRLKAAIKQIDSLIDGLRVYSYRYLGSVYSWIGLMADEVEELYPQAVSIASDGYKTVDYSKIPSWSY